MTKSLTLTIVVLQQSTYLALDYPTSPSLAIYPPLCHVRPLRHCARHTRAPSADLSRSYFRFAQLALAPNTSRSSLYRQRALRPPSRRRSRSGNPAAAGHFDTWDWFNVEEKKKPSPVSRHRLPPFLDGRWCLSVPRSRPVFLSTTVAAPATDSSRLAHHHLAAHSLPYSGHSLAQPLPRRQLARFQYHV